MPFSSRFNMLLWMILFTCVSQVLTAPASQRDKPLTKNEKDKLEMQKKFDDSFKELFKNFKTAAEKVKDLLKESTILVLWGLLGIIFIWIVTPCCTVCASCTNSWILYRIQKINKSSVNDINARISSLEKGEHRAGKPKTEMIEAKFTIVPPVATLPPNGGSKMGADKTESKAAEPSKLKTDSIEPKKAKSESKMAEQSKGKPKSKVAEPSKTESKAVEPNKIKTESSMQKP